MIKPRLCFVIPSMGIGGTERQLLYLMKGLQDTFETMVVCTHSDGAWIGDVRRLGHVKVLGLRGGWDPRLKSRLLSTFRSYTPSIVHSFMFGFDHPVNVAAHEAGVPVVISSRRQQATWKKPRHIRLQKKANLMVDAIVANCRVVAKHAADQEQHPPEKYDVIYNGIDIDAFQSRLSAEQIKRRYQIAPEKRVIGIVANFSPVKDHELFVETARELVARRNDLHFVLAGKGPELEKIGVLLLEYGLEELVTGVNTVSELHDVYHMIDVSVLTSKSEGFPNVVMESMASGTPVVAARVGGVPELIEHERTGLLMEARDPKAYADSIERFLDDAEFTEGCVRAASEHVQEHFSLDAMVASYRELYQGLLQSKVKE